MIVINVVRMFTWSITLDFRTVVLSFYFSELVLLCSQRYVMTREVQSSRRRFSESSRNGQLAPLLNCRETSYTQCLFVIIFYNFLVPSKNILSFFYMQLDCEPSFTFNRNYTIFICKVFSASQCIHKLYLLVFCRLLVHYVLYVIIFHYRDLSIHICIFYV